MPNRHRVDQLADVRSEIKQLKLREVELRAEVLDHPDNLAGDEHEAVIVEMTVERLDLDLMKAELGLLFLRPYLRSQSQTRVMLRPTTSKKRRT